MRSFPPPWLPNGISLHAQAMCTAEGVKTEPQSRVRKSNSPLPLATDRLAVHHPVGT